jgi:hypothetical protein
MEVDEDAIVNFGYSYHDFSYILTFLMLAEHIMTYIFFYVKENDLFKRGEIDSSGVKSTPLCKTLDGISFFLEFIFSLMVILHLCQLGDLLHSLPVVNYYLIVDMIVTILLVPYCYVARLRHVSVSLMKNIFTLHAVQKTK